MPNSLAGRLILDTAQDGPWNMAVDEAILDTSDVESRPTLRFYAWSPATLSLGYFQSWSERSAHAASRECPAVRRQSGGGAILHDREVTYSLTLPFSHRMARHSRDLYLVVHQGLLAVFFEEFGIHASLVPDRLADSSPQQPFLCFQRRSPGDVILEGHKVAGSAQRRRKGAVLQHGSLLLGKSEFAPELPGVQEITGVAIPESEFIRRWSALIGERLGVDWSCEGLAAREQKVAHRFWESRYANQSWNTRR